MKLIELIASFRRGQTFEDFCKSQKLDPEAEVIEIYAQEPVSLEAQLGFFPIEESEGRVEFESNGAKYHNLFDFFYFLEVIEDLSGNAEPTDAELAQRLYTYAIKDA